MVEMVESAGWKVTPQEHLTRGVPHFFLSMFLPDKLVFFSASASKPPGKGTGERVFIDGDYVELARVPHWRRVLSNFHECSFTYRGKRYGTIEHAFQARKIELADPAAAASFALDSGSELASGDGKAARKARKLVVLTAAQLREWDGMKDSVMAEIAVAKYRACEEARRVLKLTGQAQLWHAAPRMAAVRFKHLERIRAGLASSTA